MKFYKANKNIKGGATSFSFNPDRENGGFFAEMIKQISWDEKTRTGKFDTTEENKIRIKFSVNEICEMMNICTSRSGSAQFFHKTASSQTQISFGTYPKDSDSPRGIAFSAKKGDNSIFVPFSFAEATYLAEIFHFFIQRHLLVEQKSQEAYFANKS